MEDNILEELELDEIEEQLLDFILARGWWHLQCNVDKIMLNMRINPTKYIDLASDKVGDGILYVRRIKAVRYLSLRSGLQDAKDYIDELYPQEKEM